LYKMVLNNFGCVSYIYTEFHILAGAFLQYLQGFFEGFEKKLVGVL